MWPLQLMTSTPSNFLYIIIQCIQSLSLHVKNWEKLQWQKEWTVSEGTTSVLHYFVERLSFWEILLFGHRRNVNSADFDSCGFNSHTTITTNKRNINLLNQIKTFKQEPFHSEQVSILFKLSEKGWEWASVQQKTNWSWGTLIAQMWTNIYWFQTCNISYSKTTKS